MPRALITLLLITVLSAASGATAQAPQAARMALLICIDDYEEDSADTQDVTTLPDLNEPCNDADRIAARLVLLGWDEATEIRRVRNPSTANMDWEFRRLSEFLNTPSGRFGFVYLAGHGAEVNNKTYLFERRARIDFTRAAGILAGGSDRRLFAESAIELSSDVFADLSNCFCDVIVVVDTCRNDPVAFTHLNEELTEALRQMGNARRQSRDQIVVTAPQRRLLPSGLGVLYATSEPSTVLDTSPTRLALMLDIAMQPDLTIHQALSMAVLRVHDESHLTQFPQSPSLSYAARNPFLCFNRCAPLVGRQGSQAIDRPPFREASAASRLVPIRYQAPFPTTENGEPGQAVEVVWEPADSIAARAQGAISVDVFWCEGGNDEGRLRDAGAFSQRLRALGQQEAKVGDRPLGRVRLRPLARTENDSAGYRITQNVIQTDYGAAAEHAWARRMRTIGPSRLSIQRRRSVSDDYIGVFFCEGVPTMREGPRLWIQIANRGQMPIATDIGLHLRNQDFDLWVADDIDVVNSPHYSQVLYFFAEDAELAARIAQEVEAQGILSRPPVVRNHRTYRTPYMQPGMVELWIGRSERGPRQ